MWHKLVDIHALRKGAITFAQECTIFHNIYWYHAMIIADALNIKKGDFYYHPHLLLLPFSIQQMEISEGIHWAPIQYELCRFSTIRNTMVDIRRS